MSEKQAYKVAQWLDGINRPKDSLYQIANVQPVTVQIEGERFYGAKYTRVYKDRIETWLYLLSDELPKSYRNGRPPEYNSTHYMDQSGNEYYVSGYMLDSVDESKEKFHPLGPNFAMTVADTIAYQKNKRYPIKYWRHLGKLKDMVITVL